VVEVEEPQLEMEVNVEEEEQLKVSVFCQELRDGCSLQDVVVKTLAVLVAAFKRRFP